MRLRAKFHFFAVSLFVAAISPTLSFGIDDTTPPNNPSAWEKCYGIARAKKNHCTSLDNRHGCGGHASVDGDPTEWIWVPAGFCKKIVNGTKVNNRVKKVKKQSCTTRKK